MIRLLCCYMSSYSMYHGNIKKVHTYLSMYSILIAYQLEFMKGSELNKRPISDIFLIQFYIALENVSVLRKIDFS